MLTLIQLEEPNDSLANQTAFPPPEGEFVQHARLPASIDYLLQTPGELLLEGGKVMGAKEAVEPGKGF
jgi:hypothetical protein